MAVVTTGSELCTIRSNGVISLFEETVEPDCASLNPETAIIFPAVTTSVAMRSPPTNIPTDCTRFALGIPATYI